MNSVLEGLAPFGQALLAYHNGDSEAVLQLRWDVGVEAELPVSTFFERPEAGGTVEQAALARAAGSVLDVGAGSGRIALALQTRGLSVTAMDWLPEACDVMRSRGLTVLEGDLWTSSVAPRADTVLVLMNGTSVAGSYEGLQGILARLKGLMLPEGRILIDSTDPTHPEVDWADPGDGRRLGELHLQMGFDGMWGPPVPQLFVSPDELQVAARQQGLSCQVVATDEDGRYLAELTRPLGRPVSP
ncbi:MAG: class I SAM-dependent methyltransferase [Longimicrobiales bacterium]